MEQGTNFLLEIALVLIFANIGGIIAAKLKQPMVLGQILAGLIIGPAVLNIVVPDEIINSFSEIGVVLLMFIAGMETDLNDLKKTAGASSLIAIGGVVVPFVLAFFANKIIFPSSSNIESIFVGTILVATSISITVQVLREIKRLNEKTGICILGAAVIDDVLGIIVLTIVLGIASPSKDTSLIFVIGKIIFFFILIFIIGSFLIKLANGKFAKILKKSNIAVIAIIICFIIATIAEEFGVASIIGAYFTGIVFSLTLYRNKISRDVENIAFTLFTPVFFVNIGLIINLDGISKIIIPVLMLLVIAILGKILGCGLGAKLSKFKFRESMQIGIGMIPRGEVGLIVANIAKNSGFISDKVFTASILVVVLTTIITPPLLKVAYKTD